MTTFDEVSALTTFDEVVTREIDVESGDFVEEDVKLNMLGTQASNLSSKEKVIVGSKREKKKKRRRRRSCLGFI